MRITRLQLTARRRVAPLRRVAVGRPLGSRLGRELPGGRPPGDTRVHHGRAAAEPHTVGRRMAGGESSSAGLRGFEHRVCFAKPPTAR